MANVDYIQLKEAYARALVRAGMPLAEAVEEGSALALHSFRQRNQWNNVTVDEARLRARGRAAVLNAFADGRILPDHQAAALADGAAFPAFRNDGNDDPLPDHGTLILTDGGDPAPEDLPV